MPGQIRRTTWPEFPEISGQSFRNPHQSAWRSPRGSNALSRRPTVLFDFTDRSNHRVELYQTIVNPDGSLSQGARKPSLDPQDYEFVYLRNLQRLQDSRSYSARLDVSRGVTLSGRYLKFELGVQWPTPPTSGPA